jgi:hypothetical protein
MKRTFGRQRDLSDDASGSRPASEPQMQVLLPANKDVGVAAFQQNVNQTEEFVEQCHHIAIAASFACLEGNSESEW